MNVRVVITVKHVGVASAFVTGHFKSMIVRREISGKLAPCMLAVFLVIS